MNRLGIISLRPADVGGPKKSNHRAIEGGRKMPRAAIRRDEQVGASHARLDQTQRQGLTAQGMDRWMASLTDDLTGQFLLSVTDKGRGMTPDQISRIGPHMQFERKTFEQQGAGLGLVISKRMTELLGGQFQISSVPGAETVVQVGFGMPGV